MIRIVQLILILTLLLPTIVSASNDITVQVNDVLIENAKGSVVNGTTLIPLRAIFEALGATVDWDNKTQTITSTKGDITIELTIGKSSARINGIDVSLAVPGQIINGSTMVPLRFIGEAFGGTVNWNSETKSVSITTDNNTIPTEMEELQSEEILEGNQENMVELVFSDFTREGWPPNHTLKVLKVDRDKLPGAIKDFKYVLSGGVGKPTDDIGKYLIFKDFFEDGLKHDLERLNKYSDYSYYDEEKGLVMSSYSFNLLTFYGEKKNLLGFVMVDRIENGSVKTQLYPYTRIEDIKKPENFDQIYNQYLNLPSLTEGISVMVLDGHGFMTFDPTTLPDNLKHARYISFGSLSANDYDPVSDMIEKSKHNDAYIGNELISLETAIGVDDSGKNAIIKLYDKDVNLISVTVVRPNQFITSDSRYIYFQGEVYNNARIDEDDFIVERYINGILDTNFDGIVDFGTEYLGPEINEKGEEIERPGIFKCGPLFMKNDEVEYKFKSLNNDLRNLIMKHY